jgi:hypothetical protein
VKPSLCLYLLERQAQGEKITYLDADLMFFEDPRILLDELGDASIMIVPHRFPSGCEDWERLDGIYNGGWLTFRNDECGRHALVWWRARCLEWCYARREDGKFADQKYLDDWPQRFPHVHVMQHPGGGLAPWNANQYTLTDGGGKPLADGLPVVFHHYQSLELFPISSSTRLLARISDEIRVEHDPVPLAWRIYPGYDVPSQQAALLWRPYVWQLGTAIRAVRRLDPFFDAHWASLDPRGVLRRTLGMLARRLLSRRTNATRRGLRRNAKR